MLFEKHQLLLKKSKFTYLLYSNLHQSFQLFRKEDTENPYLTE